MLMKSIKTLQNPYTGNFIYHILLELNVLP